MSPRTPEKLELRPEVDLQLQRKCTDGVLTRMTRAVDEHDRRTCCCCARWQSLPSLQTVTNTNIHIILAYWVSTVMFSGPHQ